MPPAGIDEEIAALRAIVEGTAGSTGGRFFESLVGHLAAALGVSHAFVAEFAGSATRVRTLAYHGKGRILPNVEFDLAGTPCEDVVRGNLCHHPAGIREKFPDDRGLAELGLESYLGVPLLDGAGEVLGHLAVCDVRPMPPEPRTLFIFRIFAARAAAELERSRIERRLTESERRYRELYDEAPNAYVSLDRGFRLASVNRTACQLLGRTAGELLGTDALRLFAATPKGRDLAEKALREVAAGAEISGLELEVRRDDGPLWVSTWMRPSRDAGGRVASINAIWADVTDRVLAEAERARLAEQNLYLRQEIQAAHDSEEIVGRSPALLAVLEKVRRVAPTDATVLIQGETGTGKELIARAIHAASPRRDRPLIKVNCAALPAGLVESELFGHEKGAFTGAVARRTGRFALADGGSIFLDEVGELPLDVQAKLLRVLQEREFDTIGGTAPTRVDVRVIAATNRDLLAAVRERAFREDLYYRLGVFPIALPPLRDRAEDIPLLSRSLLEKLSRRIGRRFDGIDPDTLRRLTAYAWPGNVRELENVLERAVILAPGPTLTVEPDVLGASPGARPGPPDSLEAIQREHILEVLRRTRWVIEGPQGAAAALGLHPNTLRSRLKKLGLPRPTHETS
ncbi:Formate hydrogenlyase transcriptional activator [Aquisphaera giovannonii]|uniref:Formate hydrogenlyase transcriptional activator n=1 Tax=Aquisphaera giovannonii TaxID=406548 RepID=A0A5B9VY27_9BACT|nr:sigma 54-interacting transcriptional regulator [Aquisphaera giovannonii]QEH32520.1 Formate hydrogenlyase transcriptional activator [Aquisphaera giovannonii]